MIRVLEFAVHENTIDNVYMVRSDYISTGNWVSLIDYSMRKGVSLSTLRRYIKANKIIYKVVKGKYLLLLDNNDTVSKDPHPKEESFLLLDEMHQLKEDLKRAREEIAELKTLIAFYEEKGII